MGVVLNRIDLSADVGESDGDGAGQDGALVGLVTTVHIACGFHAGGPEVMRRTLAQAVAAGVAVGAHPSYPDRAGFGRRPMDRSVGEVVDDILYQVGALEALARAEGGRVSSVKPHGALYNRMAGDEVCTEGVAEALVSLGSDVRLVLPAGSSTLGAAKGVGAWVVPEAFCDRGYRPDGALVPRGTAGSLVSDPAEAARRAVLLAGRGVAIALDGAELELAPETLCVHSDTPGAVAIAGAVRNALGRAGFVVAAPGR